MEFLIFQIPYLGNGMIIGLNAIVHVLLSHGVAIGLVAVITIAEYKGVSTNAIVWENFAKDLLKPAIIIITGVGAVTGVGIWFTTSGLSPRGIGSMLRVFFWPWFTEWIIFTLEVIAILIYYFKWDTWSAERKKYRVYFGIGYIFLASISAFIITSILGFMLTTDGWPWDKSLLSAFFNPSFFPQLSIRLSESFALGALFAISYLLFRKKDRHFRKDGLVFFSKILFSTIIPLVLSLWWYFVVVPSSFKTNALFSVLTSRLSQRPEIFWIVNGVGVALIILFCISGVRRSVFLTKFLVIPALIVMIGFISEFERIREFIRGPYLIPGYMYANGILLSENLFLEKEGMLKNAYWFNITLQGQTEIEEGAYLFASNCSVCHTIGGINDIGDRVRGRTQDGIAVILSHTNEMVPFMPPFSGQEKERYTLARFLYGLSQKDLHFGSPSRYTPFNKGKQDE
jgi:hypothetical protein